MKTAGVVSHVCSPPKFSPGDKFGHKPTISLHFPVIYVPLSEGVKRERGRERERERTTNKKGRPELKVLMQESFWW